MKPAPTDSPRPAQHYQAPRLRVYGDMSRLTSGGTGLMAEGMAMTGMNRQRT